MQKVNDAAVTATGNITEIQLADAIRKMIPGAKVYYQVNGITTATVKLEGSINGTDYIELASLTADGGGTVDMWPYLRLRCSAYTAGNLFGHFDYPPWF